MKPAVAGRGKANYEHTKQNELVSDRQDTNLAVGALPIALCFLSAHPPSVPAAYSQIHNKTQNVIFVMTDGLRWQEVFRSADLALITKEEGGVIDIPA
jgi:hypothetical protein